MNIFRRLFTSRYRHFFISLGAHFCVLGYFFFWGGILAAESLDDFSGDSSGVLYASYVVTMNSAENVPSLQSENSNKEAKKNKSSKPKTDSVAQDEPQDIQNIKPSSVPVYKLKQKTKPQETSDGSDNSGDKANNNANNSSKGFDAGQVNAVSNAQSNSGGSAASTFGYSMDSVDKKPQILKNSQVPYPQEARKNKITGLVLIRFHLDKEGTVSQLHVKNSTPPGVFDNNTLAEVKKWKFSPAQKGGKQVPVWVELPIEFELR